MAVGIVAFHYPKPEHRDELVQRLAAAEDVMAATEGCVDVACWEERETGALVSTGTFTSEDAWSRAVQAVLAANVDFAYSPANDRHAWIPLQRQGGCYCDAGCGSST